MLAACVEVELHRYQVHPVVATAATADAGWQGGDRQAQGALRGGQGLKGRGAGDAVLHLGGDFGNS